MMMHGTMNVKITQHVSGDTPPIIRSSKTVIAASAIAVFELLMMGGRYVARNVLSN
jgi:hypothetical protein